MESEPHQQICASGCFQAIKRQQQHQQQQSSMQRSRANLPNTYQTHQDNSRAAQVGTQLHGDGTCRAMVDSLRAFQNHPEHRLGLHSSEAKRRVAHLDSLLKVWSLFCSCQLRPTCPFTHDLSVV